MSRSPWFLLTAAVPVILATAGFALADEQGGRAEALAAQAIRKVDRILADPPAAASTSAGKESATLPQDATDAANRPRPAAEAEDSDSEGAPPLLPPPPADSGRGMDPMGRARLDMMVPTGRSHRGVYYPSYGATETNRSVIDPVSGTFAGVTAPLQSLFESKIVTRLDDDHVQFDQARWVQYEPEASEAGEPVLKMALEIEKGVYDLKNEILMTNQPVKIENRQFTITGNTMLHDRVSGLTRLTGNVKMVCYDEPAAVPVSVSSDTNAAKANSSAGGTPGPNSAIPKGKEVPEIPASTATSRQP